MGAPCAQYKPTSAKPSEVDKYLQEFADNVAKAAADCVVKCAPKCEDPLFADCLKCLKECGPSDTCTTCMKNAGEDKDEIIKCANGSSSKLSAGAIAGISVGGLALVAFMWWCGTRFRKRENGTVSSSSTDMSTMS